MTCHQARQQLAAYRRDDWTASEMRALAEHLAGCASCRQVEATYRRVGESLRLLPTITPDAAFRESVFAAIAAEQQKLGPAAMRASRAETEPSLPVVRAPVTQIRDRRTPRPVARAAVAVAAALAIGLFATQFIPSMGMGGAAASFLRGVSSLQGHAAQAPALKSGISAYPTQTPFASDTFSATTLYQGQVGSHWEYVYAGESWTSYATHQGQAALRIYNGSKQLIGVYVAPVAAQSLKIDSAHGAELTLTADTGATLTFNLATGSFE
ncbi:MAG TPA: zf-HC2 domain-containing protein [Ktedonobacterales bacterium]